MRRIFKIEGPMRLILYLVIVISGMLISSVAWGTIPVTFIPLYPIGFGAALSLHGLFGYVAHIFCLGAVLLTREGSPFAFAVLALLVTVALTTKGCNGMAKDYSRVAYLEQGSQDVFFGITADANNKDFEQDGDGDAEEAV